MKTKLASILTLTATVSQLCAHPVGQSESFSKNILHLISTPDHLVTFGLAALLLASGLGLWLKRKWSEI